MYLFIRVIEECRKIFDKNHFIGVVAVDLAKTFNWILRDLVTGTLAAYGFDKNMTCYI